MPLSKLNQSERNHITASLEAEEAHIELCTIEQSGIEGITLYIDGIKVETFEDYTSALQAMAIIAFDVENQEV